MQFIAIGLDGSDAGASARRLAAQEAHRKLFFEMYNRGFFLCGAAILNDREEAVGSLIVCEFASQKELEEVWLKSEPYVLGNVWQEIEIKHARLAGTEKAPPPVPPGAGVAPSSSIPPLPPPLPRVKGKN